MTDLTVHRVDFGWFIRPAEETGTGAPRVEPTLGYLIDHPAGRILVDTGMGSHPDVDRHYQPRRVPLDAALRAAGATVADIRYVVNSHLHFDHCGGNPQLAGTPVFTQRSELTAARSETDYTLPELIDHPGVRYEELDGMEEILPGVRIMPTPGHTGGHQSVVVTTVDGTVIVAGQSHDHATGFTSDVLARRAASAHRRTGWAGCSTSTRDGFSSLTTTLSGFRRPAFGSPGPAERLASSGWLCSGRTAQGGSPSRPAPG